MTTKIFLQAVPRGNRRKGTGVKAQLFISLFSKWAAWYLDRWEGQDLSASILSLQK